ncbi:MFS general substrate transporter [Phlebopus sp. FC_14]|nr:MFS general substrate transporter [Phlebopus sp. FC_14]
MSQTPPSSRDSDESSPLHPNADDMPVQPTPLPKMQITTLLLTCLIEPLSSHCIFPFINQLVSELDITGGDDRKIGYYAGLIESIFFATQTLTILQWSRVSDHIGRKPVLLLGTFGLCISMLCFGLSRTFWGLVLSRCITGALNGNAGVMKSMLAELLDPTNQAQGFAFLPMTWSTGVVLGYGVLILSSPPNLAVFYRPIIGGTLYRPHERFPRLFSGPFWETYPYFLPCCVTAIFCAFTFVAILLILKETLPIRSPYEQPQTIIDCEATLAKKYGAVDDAASKGPAGLPDPDKDSPVPLRSLLNANVLLPIANYGSMSFLEIAMTSLLPLHYATPIKLGGLGLTPPVIGLWMSFIGILNGGFQAAFFAPLVSILGTKRLFRIGQSAYILIFALFPIMNIVARRSGMVTFSVQLLLFSQVCCYVVQNMAFTCIMMYVNAAAPNRRSLGAVNGLSQMVVSILRTIGPAMTTSMFACSVEYEILGGYAVYGVMILLTVVTAKFGEMLPGAPGRRRGQ